MERTVGHRERVVGTQAKREVIDLRTQRVLPHDRPSVPYICILTVHPRPRPEMVGVQ